MNKKYKKPSSCTRPPWYIYIEAKDRPEILRRIREECIEELGYSLDECPKRNTCKTKYCTGRPLPWFSDTARPYLDKLSKELGIKEEEDLFIQTDCRRCPFFKNCESPCNQVLDYIDRDKKLEPRLNYYESLEQINLDNIDILTNSTSLKVKEEDIPWDCISEKTKNIVKSYLYEQKNFSSIAKIYGLHNQAETRREFNKGITKLRKFGIIRKFLEKNMEKLTKTQQIVFRLAFYENKNYELVAKELGITRSSVQQTVARVLNKYNIKIEKTVKNVGKKVIYNTPEVLKS